MHFSAQSTQISQHFLAQSPCGHLFGQSFLQRHSAEHFCSQTWPQGKFLPHSWLHFVWRVPWRHLPQVPAQLCPHFKIAPHFSWQITWDKSLYWWHSISLICPQFNLIFIFCLQGLDLQSSPQVNSHLWKQSKILLHFSTHLIKLISSQQFASFFIWLQGNLTSIFPWQGPHSS